MEMRPSSTLTRDLKRQGEDGLAEQVEHARAAQVVDHEARRARA